MKFISEDEKKLLIAFILIPAILLFALIGFLTQGVAFLLVMLVSVLNIGILKLLKKALDALEKHVYRG